MLDKDFGSAQDFVQLDSGIIIAKDTAQAVIKERRRPIAFDFFAGCGGFSLGVMQAGFDIIGANEYNADAAMTYMVNLGANPIKIHFIKDAEKFNKAVMASWRRKDPTGLQQAEVSGSGWIKNHPEHHPGVKNFWFGDVRKLRGADILDTLGLKQGDIDLVIGGPPCQGFSRSGKQNITDPRNNLVYEYARMITELQPKTFAMEEVPDIINFYDPDGVPVIDKFCYLLQDGGFGTWDKIKKSLLMQVGAAAVMRGSPKVDTTERSKKVKPKVENTLEAYL
jgi:DNA (cytosine-5)-methyltransferase 1